MKSHMRIYTRGGDLPHEVFFFPDGQPHFKLLHKDEWKSATIEAPIRNANELFMVLLAADVLKARGFVAVSLDIRYLMAARMDRRIDTMQPFTLDVVAKMLMAVGFKSIRILDPHSTAAVTALDAHAVLPWAVLKSVLAQLPESTLVVAPDKGATDRTRELMSKTGALDEYRIIQGVKQRDPNTGKLTGFDVEDKSLLPKSKGVLIVDDLCDGGGTFTGLAKVMLDAGAPVVDLFVTHGIFSHGPELEFIRHTYTTDSFCSPDADSVTVFPVSMKDMKD